VTAYCSASDLYDHGVPRGAVPNPARPLYSLVSGLCTLDDHAFSTGDAIQFRAAGDGTLPAELTEGTTYYAELVSPTTFRVRTTPTGSAISITTATDPVLVSAPLNVDAAIEFASEVIDDALIGHFVPLDPVPAIIRITAAELAAGKLLAGHGAQSKSLSEIVDAALKRLERWRLGKPVEGASDDSHANLATPGEVAPAAFRGWCRGASDWRRWGGL
jgi:hypothetical protein